MKPPRLILAAAALMLGVAFLPGSAGADMLTKCNVESTRQVVTVRCFGARKTSGVDRLRGLSADGTARVYGPLVVADGRWVPVGRAGERNVPADAVQEVGG